MRTSCVSIETQAEKPRIPSFTKTARYRIPYELTATLLREIKDARRVSLTPQMLDYLEYSRSTGRTFILEVRQSTTLTQEMQRLVDEGQIQLRRTLPG